MRSGDYIVLHVEILDQEFHRLVVVRFDPSYFGGGEYDELRLFFGKELRHRDRVAQIKLAPITLEQVG